MDVISAGLAGLGANPEQKFMDPILALQALGFAPGQHLLGGPMPQIPAGLEGGDIMSALSPVQQGMFTGGYQHGQRAGQGKR
jgi:hypothetical protein